MYKLFLLSIVLVGSLQAYQFTEQDKQLIGHYFAAAKKEFYAAKEDERDPIVEIIVNKSIDQIFADKQVMDAISKYIDYCTKNKCDESAENIMATMQFVANLLQPIVDSSKSDEEAQIRTALMYFILQALTQE